MNITITPISRKKDVPQEFKYENGGSIFKFIVVAKGDTLHFVFGRYCSDPTLPCFQYHVQLGAVAFRHDVLWTQECLGGGYLQWRSSDRLEIGGKSEKFGSVAWETLERIKEHIEKKYKIHVTIYT